MPGHRIRQTISRPTPNPEAVVLDLVQPFRPKLQFMTSAKDIRQHYRQAAGAGEPLIRPHAPSPAAVWNIVFNAYLAL
jgi:hypothetical protein